MTAPTILKTVLGSCVGVTFREPRLGLGALCHGVLPRCPPGVPPEQGYRYVDFAIRDLVSRFERLGVQRAELETKVFGGADVLPVFVRASVKGTVGYQNSLTAAEVLREQGLDVIASDTGGVAGRVIRFDTETGEVLLRRVACWTDKDQMQLGLESSR